ncbi:MAG: PAS domain-containing sensor histidine kinase [Pseudomonadota bacterium]
MSTSVKVEAKPDGNVSAHALVGPEVSQPNLYAPLYWLGFVGAFSIALLALPAHGAYAQWTPAATFLAIAAAHAVLFAGFWGEQWPALRAKGSIAILCVTLGWATAHTGGLGSELALFFVLAPIEALLTRQTRLAVQVAGATALSFLAAVAISPSIAQVDLVHEEAQVALQIIGVMYALTLAARLVKLANLKDLRLSANQRAIDQFHAITHDVFLIVRRDGFVERAFGAVQAVLSLDRDAIEGNGLINRVHVGDRPRLLAEIDTVFALKSRGTLEVRIRTGDVSQPQSFIWTSIDLSSTSRHDGAVEIYALLRDISATKDHEAQLHMARERAEASDAAKGRFLATMSHELRTPLNAIIGFADILDEEVFGALNNDQQREYVSLIRDSGGHLLQLVNDLLDMSKLEAGHFHIVAEPFSVGKVIDRCAKLMSSQAEKARQNLIIDMPEDLPELVADQRAIRQVLINLLSNASKFTPDGGTITVKVRRDGPMLSIAVIDTGIGLNADDIGRLGEPFFQANNAYDRKHQGTGLGLSVVKGLCGLHQGTIGFTSVEGEGTTATVRLPIAGPRHDPIVTKLPVDRAEVDNAVVFAKLNASGSDGSAVRRSAADEDGSAESVPVKAPNQDRMKAHG